MVFNLLPSAVQVCTAESYSKRLKHGRVTGVAYVASLETAKTRSCWKQQRPTLEVQSCLQY